MSDTVKGFMTNEGVKQYDYNALANKPVADYYSTTREELAVTLGKANAVPNDVTSAVIWGLYDALMAKYPDRVRKNPIRNDDGSFTNYEYVVSNRDYNEAIGAFKSKDDHIKKPKYLVACGIHGWEKASILSTYRLFRDIVTGHNVPTHFKEGCVIHFLPIGNPWSLDHDTWSNEGGVNINRNFDWNWNVNLKDDPKSKPGTGGNSEKETQAIVNWLKANKDAQLFLDCHNVSPGNNEIVTFVGLKDSKEYDREKKIAMRGVDRVIPFWKDVIGYADDTIFRNSSGIGEGGISIFYAAETSDTKDWRIPSLNLELSVRPTGTETTSKNLDPETIAVAAEVIGNVLLEFYEQYAMSEVMEEMYGINAKIDKALSFHVETGVYEVKENDNEGTALALVLPCTLDPKVIVIEPDREEQITITKADGSTESKTTYEWILASEKEVFIGAVVQFLANFLPMEENKDSTLYPFYFGYMAKMTNTGTTENQKWEPKQYFTMCRNNGTQMQVSTPTQKIGKYHWTAYYWND